MNKFINRSGQVYGRLTVVSRAASSKTGNTMWNCKCECGNLRVVLASQLGSGRSKSCGCSRINHGCARGKLRTREFATWISMRNRCRDPGNPRYHRYGGRGISICSRWLDSFESFLSDMGFRPTSGHSIDRIDNDGNYEPSNCRWATRQEQADNRKVTIWYTLDGVTKSQSQWGVDLGGSVALISSRLKIGWTVEEAITTPAGNRRATPS